MLNFQTCLNLFKNSTTFKIHNVVNNEQKTRVLILEKCYENAISYSMLVINISCYEELSMLFQLVFLKYAMLWPELVFLQFSIDALVINSYIQKKDISKYSTVLRIWNKNLFVIHISFRSS